ncbi:putative integral membrane protein [Calothrix parasitica NIES-267]|uniref:methanethiol S-methyltransferase n=1 Tax=Calothrix parasitica NIES-267 TaxID=1973488 RepID=A0A1Z4M1W4_9CYAN|nr:putative integral membrane protein [Calothrix parasitica NIES-267]
MTQSNLENQSDSFNKSNILRRILFFIYGLVCYGIFLVTLLYAVGFFGNFLVPKSIDTVRTTSFIKALITDSLLLAVFGIQHSGMARKGFKNVWTKIIPKPIERSTYVLCASLTLILLFWQWQSLRITLWDLSGTIAEPILWCLCGLGWLIVLLSTFMINHFELFGLQQVLLNLIRKEPEEINFKIVGFYNYVRHPIYLGFIIAFWSTPMMTLTHLFFSCGILAYILIGIFLEEKDLIAEYGNQYQEYKNIVSMLIPNLF